MTQINESMNDFTKNKNPAEVFFIEPQVSNKFTQEPDNLTRLANFEILLSEIIIKWDCYFLNR